MLLSVLYVAFQRVLQLIVGLEGLLPGLGRAGQAREAFGGLGDVLAMDDLDRGVAEHLVAEPDRDAFEIGELLGGVCPMKCVWSW